MLDLSQAPVVLDLKVLKQLRSHLRSIKKCFTGKEFVLKVMEIGRGALAESLDQDMMEADRRPSPSQQKLHLLQSPTGQPIEYNKEYANAVAQYLLDKRILIQVPRTQSVSESSSNLLTPDLSTTDMEYEARERTDSLGPLGANSALSLATDSPNLSLRSDTANSRRIPSTVSDDQFSMATNEGGSPRQEYGYRQRLGGQERHHFQQQQQQQQQQQRHKLTFSSSSSVFYKFAASEDSEFALLQSQILVASSASSRSLLGTGSSATRYSGSLSTRRMKEEKGDLNAARKGTLGLIYDLLSQRARKEKVARHFINSPSVQDQKRRVESANSDLIFKM